MKSWLVTLLEVSEREDGVVALHLPNGPLETALGWSQYRDANPVEVSEREDDAVVLHLPIEPLTTCSRFGAGTEMRTKYIQAHSTVT